MQNQAITINEIGKSLGGKPANHGWQCICPAHPDKNPSLSISQGSDGKILYKCHAGCSQDAVKAALQAKGLWAAGGGSGQRRTEYIYSDLGGRPALRVTRVDRSEGKQVFQSHMESGKWANGGFKGELLPYKFEKWADEKERWLFLVEGEKKADALLELGMVATCIPGGAKAWRAHYAKHFAGRRVCILPDQDTPGFAFAAAAFTDIKPLSAKIVVVELPGLKPAEDVYDWLHAGHSIDELKALVESPPVYSAELAAALGQPPVKAQPQFKIYFKLFKDIEPNLSAEALVPGLLGTEAMSVVYGESNSGKSFFALDLSLHIAEGREWFGRKLKQGAVVYVAAEAGSSILGRVEAYRQHYGLETADLPFAVVPCSVDLLAPDGDTDSVVRAVASVAEQTKQKVVFIVIDTLARAIAGGNENASQDMGAFVRNLDRIRTQAGAHLCVVHHAGKDTTRGARGHSSLRAATDTEIEIANHTARATKQRDMPIAEAIGFTLAPIQIGQTGAGEVVTSCVVQPREVQLTSGRGKLSEKPLQALEVLRSLVEAVGTAPPAGVFCAPGVRVVSVEAWRARFFELHYAGAQRSTRSQGFSRAAEELFAKKYVETQEGVAWLAA